ARRGRPRCADTPRGRAGWNSHHAAREPDHGTSARRRATRGRAVWRSRGARAVGEDHIAAPGGRGDRAEAQRPWSAAGGRSGSAEPARWRARTRGRDRRRPSPIPRRCARVPAPRGSRRASVRSVRAWARPATAAPAIAAPPTAAALACLGDGELAAADLVPVQLLAGALRVFGPPHLPQPEPPR